MELGLLSLPDDDELGSGVVTDLTCGYRPSLSCHECGRFHRGCRESGQFGLLMMEGGLKLWWCCWVLEGKCTAAVICMQSVYGFMTMERWGAQAGIALHCSHGPFAKYCAYCT